MVLIGRKKWVHSRKEAPVRTDFIEDNPLQEQTPMRTVSQRTDSSKDRLE